MERGKRRASKKVSTDFGVSFSIKQCRNFGLEPLETLKFLHKTMGFQRFRIMSYWDEHEPLEGTYDFATLDKQIKYLEKNKCRATFCLGARQPRWPESHWPGWALQLPKKGRYQKLYDYLAITIDRYKSSPVIRDYQLENEALNRSFGQHGDFNRRRLRKEMKLVRMHDPLRSVVMSTSNTWGLPIRRPWPDSYGFTFYQVQFEHGAYSRSKMPSWWYDLRSKLIIKPCFIHELQAEPWGPKAIWEMSIKEQDESMPLEQLQKNIDLAKNTNLYPIDLWGGEWWYWRHKKYNDDSVYRTILTQLG
jgi:hypothetical protein